ncbi:pilus assembly protein [Methylobacter psychrophilus]|uniref:pilus assembly protein n=1 Tax=Methylobacter psychrophilus TaxID=96941 RepID=UPI0021D5086E|nr:PilC/PilY family type IV pilus protein [Methylobacter psychrophilus]
MHAFKYKDYPSHKDLLPRLLLSLLLGLVANTSHAGIAASPLFLTISVTPVVMLNISKDQQLYFKAFDDYSDLDNDGIPETTYKHSVDYYGYFDSYKCYSYTNNRFEPGSTTANKYCNGLWSGNFLNWASMTRIDTIRKILYGGLRSTDIGTTTTTTTGQGSNKITITTTTPGMTVLERSYLPNDAHSFAKFYSGSDLASLTPFTSTSGITLCNTTVSGTKLSQNVSDAPLIRVVKGNYSLWAANERWQCRWSGEKAASNSNVFADSGINAASNNPNKTTNGLGDYNVRIKVCDSNYIGTENCKTYPDGTLKPIGLLQAYGDEDKLRFGMMTGSFGKNKSGGVLRKNVSSITNEINVTSNGTFKLAPSTGGIINTLNRLRIHGYRHDDGTYFGTTGSNNCTWGLNIFSDGNCSNWGNPQAEIFLESLRYLSNHSALSTYLPANSNTDSTYISGLTIATANNPTISATEWCSKLNVIQFNASISSYDGDQLGGVADISTTAMNALTNTVGSYEVNAGNSYFVGENGINKNQLCTGKPVNNLSDVKGICPDAPRLSGTYHIAGLAQFAHNNDIQLTLPGKQLVTTYGVALSAQAPKIIIPVPDSVGNKTVTLLPACQNSGIGGNCTIVDFKIVHQDCNQLSPIPSASNCGKIYVNWEDSEQGGDFDQDQWGILTYKVSSTQVQISTKVIAQSTPYKMGFGYIISGTTKDGFHAHSGINDYDYNDPQGTTACTNCILGNAASTATYTIGSGSALSLQQPLYYAAKWGGFIDSNNNGIPDLQAEWDSDGDGKPDRYFFATNPSELASSLSVAFANVVATSASASAVAANSTRLDTGTQVYQAKFKSTDWSGQLQAYSVNTGTGGLTPTWETSTLIPAYGLRKIYTYNSSMAVGQWGVSFGWNNLSKDNDTPAPLPFSQQHYLHTLNGIVDNNGLLRLNWLLGDDTNEKTTTNPAGIFRDRASLLGDIVNSDPVYVGSEDSGYSNLPGIGTAYSTFLANKGSRRPMLYVGANDGMLHGFDAGSTGSGGQEIFAYIPNALFPELSKLTSPGYVHQYFVDGMSAAGDVYYGSAWHTLLAGTTGAGGRAVFALDITNPDAFGASSALWEFTNTSKPDGTPNPDGGDLGYTLAQPSVVRMQDGHWAVIVANGYNSDYGHAVLFIFDASTGAVLQKIDTGAGPTTTKNGLSSPMAVDTNNDLSVDTIYAGDLHGNLWKFDVSGSAGSWPVPSTPFFVACSTAGGSCSEADRQPITSKPNIGPVGVSGADQNGVGLMVYVGTGKYFEDGINGDNIVGVNPPVQSFYGLWDKGLAITDRSLLKEQTIDFEGIAMTLGGTPSTNPVRVVSKNTVCYATTAVGCASSPLKFGWALNLLTPPNNTAEGERVVSFPLVRRGLVIFATVIPSPDPCESGGNSRLMELDALSGGESGGVAFNVNGNGIIDANDFVIIAGVKHVASGINLGIGITKTPAVVTSNSVDYKYLSSSTGQMGTVIDTGGAGISGIGGSGIRRSWQQLK